LCPRQHNLKILNTDEIPANCQLTLRRLRVKRQNADHEEIPGCANFSGLSESDQVKLFTEDRTSPVLCFRGDEIIRMRGVDLGMAALTSLAQLDTRRRAPGPVVWLPSSVELGANGLRAGCLHAVGGSVVWACVEK